MSPTNRISGLTLTECRIGKVLLIPPFLQLNRRSPHKMLATTCGITSHPLIHPIGVPGEGGRCELLPLHERGSNRRGQPHPEGHLPGSTPLAVLQAGYRTLVNCDSELNISPLLANWLTVGFTERHFFTPRPRICGCNKSSATLCEGR